MKTLNLVYPERSDVKYKISKFPDGQQQITIDTKMDNLLNIFQYPIHIKSRLNNFQDLELIICAVKSLRSLGIKDLYLYTPYFLGSRSDRKFEDGSNNYLKDIICPIINDLGFESVTVLDPHSDVLEACLNGFKKVSNIDLCWFAFKEIYGIGKVGPFSDPNFILVSPDAGASKKIYKIAEEIGYKEDIITCTKDRDNEGKLTKCIVPWEEEYFGKDLIIIDDICDGGATFVNIAKELKDLTKDFNPPKIYLIVTHGIFSKGNEELEKYFDYIYCTNSYKDIDSKINRVKQLNVF